MLKVNPVAVDAEDVRPYVPPADGNDEIYPTGGAAAVPLPEALYPVSTLDMDSGIYRCPPWMRYLSMVIQVLTIGLSASIYYLVHLVVLGYEKYIHDKHSDSASLNWLVFFLFYFPVLVETSATIITMIVCLYYTIRRPERILISEVNGCKTICLCITIFILTMLSAYTTVVMAVDGTHPDSEVPMAVPLVRTIAMLMYFIVLVVVSCL